MRNTLWIVQIIFSMIIIPRTSVGQSFTADQPPVTEVYQLANQLMADYGSLSRFYFIQDSPERRERFQAFFND